MKNTSMMTLMLFMTLATGCASLATPVDEALNADLYYEFGQVAVLEAPGE